MKLRQVITRKGYRAHHIDNGGVLYLSKGFAVYSSVNSMHSLKHEGQVEMPLWKSFLSYFGLLSRLLRLGIHNIICTLDGSVIVFAEGTVYRKGIGEKKFQKVFDIPFGKRPLRKAVCCLGNGRILFGEYWNNPNRDPVRIFVSKDDGVHWDVLYTFPKESIRHIHCLVEDPYTRNLWIATGDRDDECYIGFSKDNATTFEFILHGQQMYRTLDFIFTEDNIFYGTDVPDGQNAIFAIDRSHYTVKRIEDITGPAYYATVTKHGVKIIATTVEGGKGEFDRYARLYGSVDGWKWYELSRWKKDIFPTKLFGYGQIFFPTGTPSEYVIFSIEGLGSVHPVTVLAKIEV